MTVAANNRLYEMENLARMQVVATLAASIIVARNATEMGISRRLGQMLHVSPFRQGFGLLGGTLPSTPNR
jgi:hypothetical protein